MASTLDRANDVERDAARYRWLNEQGRGWTFWLGRTYTVGTCVWPVFPDQSLDAEIDRAIEREAMQRCEAVQV